jgi:hypothetical protein
MLGFAGAKTVTRKTKVRTPPTIGQLPDTDFDTIWTAIFTLDGRVKKEREIWLITDKDEFDQSNYLPGQEPVIANNTTETANNSTANGTSDANSTEGVEDTVEPVVLSEGENTDTTTTEPTEEATEEGSTDEGTRRILQEQVIQGESSKENGLRVI